MITMNAAKGGVYKDNSGDLPKTICDLVKAAMDAGLTDFTTPTDDDNQERIEWCVRTWLCVRNKKPAALLVAYKLDMAHFEVLGPEIQLAAANGIQRR